MTRLVHTGNAIVDLVLTIDALPSAGGDVLASSSTTTAGGAFNTLLAARRDGLEAVHVGARGSGPFADIVASALADAGVSALGPVVDVDSGYSVVLVDRSAERTFVTHIGAEAHLRRQDLEAVALDASDLVVVSGYSLAHSPTVLPEWVAGLPDEVRVVFDPSPLVASLDTAALAAVLGRADVVTANAAEAVQLVRRASAEGSECLGPLAARLAGLLRPGGWAVVRTGADGCWVAEHGAPPAVRIPGFPSRALDTTGAGDTHCGVLCAGLARGDSLAAAARRANAAASIAVGRRGPATAPRAEEIEALLASDVDPA